MTRDTITSGTAGAVTGDDYMDNVAGHIDRFWDASALPLTSVGGTANAVTATLDPPLLAGVVEGMKVTITWGAANTGAMTLDVGTGAVAVLDASGAALVGGEVSSGLRSLLEVVGSSFRLLTGASAAGGPGPYYEAFTASGTWTVPTGFDADTSVVLQAWGGGGGGGTSPSGGGGGGFVERRMRYADLSASYTVTIGAGGAPGNAGGTTSIGAILSVHGGGQGGNNGGGGAGGAGGSAFGAGGGGGTATGGAPVGRDAGAGGDNGASGESGVLWGGGGGSGASAIAAGGMSVFGGGGGGGGAGGGTSRFGGNGGALGVAGSAPGGGGGGSGASGARGEVRIWIG